MDLSDWEWGGETSFEVYFKPQTFTSGTAIFEFSSGSSADFVRLTLAGSTGSVMFNVFGNGQDNYAVGTNVLEAGTWAHVVATVGAS